MSSSYEFLFDIILDNSNSIITIPNADISDNIVVDASDNNLLDNLEEPVVNILNSYMNPVSNTLDSSGATLSNFLQRRTLPVGQNYIYENSNLDSEYMSFLNSLLGAGGNSRFNNILNSSLNDTDEKKYKNVISEEAKDCIKIKEYTKTEYIDQLCCPMTLNDFKEGDTVAELSCKHIFEKNAIFKWLEKEDNRCPVCREELPSKEIKIENNSSTEEETNDTQESTLLPRMTTTQLLSSIVNREIRRQDEEDLQTAIMASLLDVSNN